MPASAMHEATAQRYSIFNSDQGSQFTSSFTDG